MNINAIKNDLIHKFSGIDFEKMYEIICLCYVFLYFIYIGNIISLSTFLREIRGIVACIAIIHVLVLIIRKGIYKHLIIDILFLLFFSKIVLFCSSNVDVEFYIDTLVLAICVLGIDYRKVFQSISLSFGVSIIGSFLCAYTNIVDCYARNYQRTNYGITTTIIRSAWGYIHENILGMWCFVAIVCWGIGFNQFSKFVRGLLAFVVAAFVWVVPNSIFNFVLLILFGIALWTDYLYDLFLKENSFFVGIRKSVEVIALVLAFLVPFSMIWIVINYEDINPNFLTILDNISSGRIYLAHNGYLDYGFSLWGQYYKSGSYLDSGWIRIPVIYGIPMMLLVLALFMYIGYKALKKDDFLLVWVILLLSISGICYELVTYVCYCVFLIVPFAKYGDIDEKRQCVDDRFINKLECALYKYMTLIVIFVEVVLFLIFRKSIISTLQTLIECKSYTKNMSMGLIVLFLILLAMFAMGFSSFIKMGMTRVKRMYACLLPVSCIGLILLFTYSWHSNTSIEKDSIAYESIIADEEAMSVLETIEDANVVPQSKPYLYKKYYGFTDLKWLPTADYARFDNITVIVDVRDNYRTFSNTGFVQTPISNYHKIYTNDNRVIETMEKAGYKFTYYSQYVKVLDLTQYAKLNRLEQAKDGSLLAYASEKGQVITNKADEDFNVIGNYELKTPDENGNYNLHIVIETDLDLLPNMNPEDCVAHLVIASSSDTYLDYRITVSEFNDGTAICDIPFSLNVINGGKTPYFTIDEAYTIDFTIKEISYYRTE